MSDRAPTGADLKATRGRLGLSQAQLARDWGISDRMVRKLEKGGTLPAGYQPAARALSGGRTIAPQRRRTKAGAYAKVRAPKGRSVRPTVHAPGSDLGITYAKGTKRGAPVVRRVETWVPFADTPRRGGETREQAFEKVGQAVTEAWDRGQRAVVAVSIAKGRGRGGYQAGYSVTIVGLRPGAPTPHGAGVVVLSPGDLELLGELTGGGGLDDLADDVGAQYGDL